MSLSALLDKLNSLVSKSFVFGAFIPTLVFAFLNATLLYFEATGFRNWADAELRNFRGFDAASITVGLAVTAYMISSVNVFLRETLEGKYLLIPALQRRLQSYQGRQLDRIREHYRLARDNRIQIAGQKLIWQQWLSSAALFGKLRHPSSTVYDPVQSQAGRKLAALRTRQASAEPPSYSELLDGVYELCEELQKNDISSEPAPGTTSSLGEHRNEMLRMFDYAEKSWGALEVRHFNERQSRFGLGYIAPTALGNVAESMQSYAMSRYSLNLETFWSRLQVSLQNNRDFFSTLQDAKIQLDFLVACCWFSCVTWIAWTAGLLFRTNSVSLFLIVATTGPILSYLFYLLATTNYMAFAELVRTSVDLFRFSLLQALHVSVPKGIRQERVVWQSLQSLASYGQDWVELSYKIEDKGPAT